MKSAAQVVFRRLTQADFYNINKPKGSERRGGGQTYIDFPTSAVTLADWERFFAGVKKLNTTSGPLWVFRVESVGIGRWQRAQIGQRRDATYSIRSQTLGTKNSNRIYSWHPEYGEFPTLADPTKREGPANLVIYLIRSSGGEFWAGWFQAAAPDAAWDVDERLQRMFSGEHGNIVLDPAVQFDETDNAWPFRLARPAMESSIGRAASRAPVAPAASATARPDRTSRPGVSVPSEKQITRYKPQTEEAAIEALFENDVSGASGVEKQEAVVVILKRNQKIVAALKSLYRGECQISGRKYTFEKESGELYSEAHHLIPLGDGGADSPYNVIIVSPLIHRMLHYATVSGIDLSKIADNRLAIKINGEEYIITWHPKHSEVVNRSVVSVEGSS